MLTKDALGDPIQKTIRVTPRPNSGPGGYAVTFDAIGLAAVRLDKRGKVEAMAAGVLRLFKSDDLTVELSERSDIALWRDSKGEWRGVLQGQDGPVPEALARITRNWSRRRLPVLLGH